MPGAKIQKKYAQADVEVINNILKNNDPEQYLLTHYGWHPGCPESWQGQNPKNSTQTDFIRWEYDRIVGLNLSFRRLIGCPDLGPLDALERLDLSFNELSGVIGLERLTGLKRLDLSRNQLQDIGLISGLKALEKVCFRYNQLSRLGDLSALSKLSKLDLAYNCLTEVGDLSRLGKLQVLYLEENQLSEVGDLGQLTELSYLNVANNRFTELGDLKRLTKLKQLEFQNNPTSTIDLPAALAGSLEHFGFSGRQIRSLSLKDDYLPRLKELDIASAPEFENLDLAGRSVLLNLKGYFRADQIKNAQRSSGVTIGSGGYRMFELRPLANLFQSAAWMRIGRQSPTLGDVRPGLKTRQFYFPSEISPELVRDCEACDPESSYFILYSDSDPAAFPLKDRKKIFSSHSRSTKEEAVLKLDKGRLAFPRAGNYYLTLVSYDSSLTWDVYNDFDFDFALIDYQDPIEVTENGQ